MIWTVEFTRDSQRDLKRLALSDQRRIVDFLQERAASHESPRILAKRLTAQKEELWRFRVGDFRVIVRFIDSKMEILVVEVGHRRDIYR